jgi:hypothetical protein
MVRFLVGCLVFWTCLRTRRNSTGSSTFAGCLFMCYLYLEKLACTKARFMQHLLHALQNSTLFGKCEEGSESRLLMALASLGSISHREGLVVPDGRVTFEACY